MRWGGKKQHGHRFIDFIRNPTLAHVTASVRPIHYSVSDNRVVSTPSPLPCHLHTTFPCTFFFPPPLILVLSVLLNIKKHHFIRYNKLQAKCHVRVIRYLRKNCIQANIDLPEILRHVIMSALRRPSGQIRPVTIKQVGKIFFLGNLFF